jgi:hypothetical protein
MRNGRPLEFTGRTIVGEVTNIVEGYGLMPGWVVMTLEIRDRSIDITNTLPADYNHNRAKHAGK